MRRNSCRAWWVPVVLLALLWGSPVAAQRGTIYGTVRAEGSREPVPHAAVQIPQLGRGVLANDRGYFVLPAVPPGSYTVRANALGYRPVEQVVNLVAGAEQPLEFLLPQRPVEVAGLTVQVAREEGITGGAAGPGPIRVDPTVVDVVPALAEADVLRALQTLPSVQAISDFSSALYVRGGSPDQNLMLLDGAPLFNPFHLGGVFGSIDPEAVAAVNMLPGAFPARVGDRVSSVIEMRTREGGRDRVRGNGSVGLVSSRVSLDGPLPGARGSYLLSARRTYLDLFTDAAYKLGLIEGTLPYSFDDANLKLTHDVGTLGRLSLALHYDGENVDIPDDLDFSGDADFAFGTRSASLNYWQPLGPLVTEFRAALSSFDGNFFASEERVRLIDPEQNVIETTMEPILRAETTIRNALLAGDVSWYRGDHLLRAGAQLDQYWFDYDIDIQVSDLSTFIPNFQLAQSPLTLAAYVEDQWSPGEKVEVRLGMRVLSAGDRGTAWMPRFGLQYQLTPRVSLSVGAGRYAQVLHSLRDEESLAASLVAYDLLAAVPEEIGLTRAEDAVVGAAWSSPNTSLRLDLYAKRFLRLPIAPTPDELLEAPVIVTEGFVEGEGSARGVEFLGRQRWGAAEFSLAYSFLVASRTVNGESYPPRFERRHTVDALALVPLGRRGQASARFVFGSGQPYTPAIGVASPYVFDPDRKLFNPLGFGDRPVIVLGEHNAARLPHYLRVDVAARRSFERRWFGRMVTFTPFVQILNVLNTRNVLFGEPTATGFGRPTLEYAPQLPIFPTLGL
ncbi:MAG TPA: TonB-dependent receptor, partial [Longimicrobiaceae bacterium]|nr:TonB-dependent receptor [Longimicrobiaceae bacterium]